MAKLEFNDLSFEEKDGNVRVNFLRLFYFDVLKRDFDKIGKWKIDKKSIEFDVSEKTANNKFNQILSDGFGRLINKLNENKVIYIHKNSGIPLIGANSFGLIDRNTNTIEVKPITGCNLNCIFCSVDEGKDTRKKIDFVVEEEYLVDEFKKLAKNKEGEEIYGYINVQGEPLLYEPIVDLVRNLKKINKVKVGIITNGAMLSEKIIDDLTDAGLDRLNISLSAMNQKKADELAGTYFNLDKTLEMIKYANKKLEVVIAPIYMKGLNDEEIEKVIEFAISIRKGEFPIVGIQNFLHYKLGRNPVKQLPWEDFEEEIEKWEKKYEIDLHGKNFYQIIKDGKLEKPFQKGEVISVELICPDRYKDQMIAKANDRIVTVMNCSQDKGKIKVKIIRDKHNIFVAMPA